jgi:hypothetical protein
MLEIMLRIPFLHARPVPVWLEVVHLPFAVSFFTLFLALKFRYTGLKSPRVHAWLTYVVGLCLVVALVTGAPMFYML